MDLDWRRHPHRRFNPLLGEWVLVSPHRTERPWLGATEQSSTAAAPQYDPKCYLCPGNARAGSARNPAYTSTFVFDNDFPALLPDTPYAHLDTGELLVAEAEKGICRVGCFSPRHDLTLSQMDSETTTAVVDMWCDQYSALAEIPFIKNVQIFENHGEMMGASNPHPHCQIWANESIPDQVLRESANQLEYDRRKASCLLCDYLALERDGERMVCQNGSFSVLVPFWAVWPFETIVIGNRHATALDELTPSERTDLGDILHQITKRYDRIFGVPFPYSMGFHQQPVNGNPQRTWHMHVHFFPPLLRSASVRKFMVGYEMLAGPQRDLTAETAAERLRALGS